MTALAAGSSTTVSLSAGQTLQILRTSASGLAVLGAGSRKGSPQALSGGETIGPFPSAQDVHLSCKTGAMEYIVGALSGAPPGFIGSFTFSTLPAAGQYPAGTVAYTVEYGPVVSNGTAWVLGPPTNGTTWAARPSASALGAGSLITVTDLGVSGVLMRSDGTNWPPVNGRFTAFLQGAAITTVANTTEQVFGAAQVVFPAGLLVVGAQVQIHSGGLGKSSNADTSSLRFRFGTAGTTADAQVADTTPLATTNQTVPVLAQWRVESLTTLRRVGARGVVLTGQATGAPRSADTVPDVSANANILSLTSAMTSGTETMTLHGLQVDLVM